ncbi:MAG: hypothetical protein IH941_04670 [Acidobacteria bacterium]|nr:hypothetical protein [Acidobacteriota bacterium]
MDPPNTVVCMECAGVAHRSSYAPYQGFEPGDVVAYACEDCNHRLDLVLEPEEEPTDGAYG